MPLKAFLIYVCLLLAVGETQAQHPYYYNLNEENGLPSNEIYRLAEDSLGRIWIGSSAGLHCYNGITFRAFTNPAMNSRSLSGLRFDKRGRLWCANFTGQIFYVDNDSLHLFRDYSKVCKSYPLFTFDRTGNLWVSADQVVEVFAPSGKLLRQFSGYRTAGHPVTWDEVETDSDGTVYLHTYNAGIWKHTGSLNNRLEKIPVENADEKLLNNKAGFYFLNHQLHLLVEINPERSYQIYSISNKRVRRVGVLPVGHAGDLLYGMQPTPRHEILALSSAGVLRLNERFAMSGRQPLFPEAKISHMLIDREGSYWFSSLESGLFVIPSIDLELYKGAEAGLADDNISALTVRNRHELILGTYSGDLYTFGTATGQASRFMRNSPTLYRHVRKLKHVHDTIFAARGIFSVLHHRTENPIRIWGIRDFDVMNDTLYTVVSDRVIRMSLTATRDSSKPEIIRGKGGAAIVCDPSTRSVYFACNDGLFCLREGALSPISYKGKPIYATCLQLAAGELWVGTLTEGILRYTPSTNTFGKGLSTADGLCSNSIRSLLVNANGAWVVSENCLNRYGHGTGVHTYNLAEGLLSRQINAMAVRDDTLWIATSKGLFRMPVNMEASNATAPRISITRFLVNDHELPHTSHPFLHWSQNNIHIAFEGVSLRSRGNFQYRYRLTGYDTGWSVSPATGNTVRYNSLAPGSYRFEVMCVNEDDVHGPVAVIPFTVQRPYWQEWWFALMVALATGVSVYLVFTLRVRMLRSRAEERNRLILSQLTALKAQMNPHFMYNTLNSIQDLIVQQDIKSTNYYLSQFGSLMRKILDASGNEQILLNEEIDILQLYLALEKLRFGDQFTYTIAVQDDVDRDRVYIPSMIIQPFVENAIKHGLLHKHGPKQLTIRFSREERELVCTITDNGIGRQRAAEIKARARQTHRSFATEATAKRLELINNTRNSKIHLHISDLKTEHGAAAGTEVSIRIPL